MKKLLYIGLFLLATKLAAQHSAIYSQYVFSGILINPAYAGSQNALNVTTVYRNQWTGIKGAPRNFSFAAHSPLKNEKVNVGFTFTNDKFGITSQSQINAMYAYRIKIWDGSLAFGIEAGLNTVKNNWGTIETTQIDDPTFENNALRKSTAEFGTGLYFSNQRFFAGVSSPALFNFKINEFATSMFYGGAIFTLSDNVKIKPSLCVKYIKHSPTQVDINSTIYLKDIIGIGLGYRTGDAAYGFVDIKINEQFNLGYNYDFTLSRLSTYSHGSHEIMIRYLFGYTVKSKSIRYF